MPLRSPLLGVVVLVCLLAPVGAEDDAAAARALVEKGITALGGAKVLAAEGSLTGSSQGTIYVLNQKAPLRNEWVVQGLDRFKWSSDVTLNNQSSPFVLVLTGSKLWIKSGDQPASEADKDGTGLIRDGFIALRIAETLLPLRGKEYTLSALGEVKVNDKPALGLKVKRKGMPEFDLFLDKATLLPVKGMMRVKETDGQEKTYTAAFADYKKVDGRQHFTRLTLHREDELVLDMKRGDIKVGDKRDDSTFAQP